MEKHCALSADFFDDVIIFFFLSKKRGNFILIGKAMKNVIYRIVLGFLKATL